CSAAVRGMDPPSALGAAVTLGRMGLPSRRSERSERLAKAGRIALATLLSLLVSAVSRAEAAERYAIIVSGASGGAAYAAKYETLRVSLTTTLRDSFGYKTDHLFVLADGEGVEKATRENVQRLLATMRTRITKDDQLLIFLLGHGTTAD